jgi:hypothetical protein
MLRYGSMMLLALAGLSATANAINFHFTVTADPRDYHASFASTLQAINTLVGGPGAFHVTVGDEDNTVPENRAQIDAKFGGNYPWYPVIGNHEQETAADMTWLRNEYLTGNGVRTPLKNYTLQNGPTGSVETTFSWNYDGAHFVVLNEYWNGGTAPGSDIAADGDVVPPLRNWLAADLAANRGKPTFVFGHEPAFPANRHVGDSLDAHPDNRDAFWSLLETENVQSFLVGHTHVYSTHLGDKNGVGDVWQIDAGNAGNGSPQTFVDVGVTDTLVTYRAYNNSGGAFHLVESWTQPVPEPSTLVLLGIGAIGLLAYAWRRRRTEYQCGTRTIC